MTTHLSSWLHIFWLMCHLASHQMHQMIRHQAQWLRNTQCKHNASNTRWCVKEANELHLRYVTISSHILSSSKKCMLSTTFHLSPCGCVQELPLPQHSMLFHSVRQDFIVDPDEVQCTSSSMTTTREADEENSSLGMQGGSRALSVAGTRWARIWSPGIYINCVDLYDSVF